MHKIIRKGNGEFYVSVVFAEYSGYSAGMPEMDGYIVFNEEKTKLVFQPMWDLSNPPYRDLLVLDYKNYREDWSYIDLYNEVDLFDEDEFQDELEYILDNGFKSEKFYKRCLELDAEVEYKEWNEIKTEQDIKDLLKLAVGFQDSTVDEVEELEDGSLLVSISSLWEFNMEIIFSNDVSYNKNALGDYNDMGDTELLYEDGYYCLVNDFYSNMSEIEDYNIWFKAKEMKFKVIPH